MERAQALQKSANLKQLVNNLAQKLAELEMQANEHLLVLETISELDNSRRCFRLVGGVLVERTVGEVQPAVVKQRDQIMKVIETLRKQLKDSEAEADELNRKWGLDKKQSQQPTSAVVESSGSTGVLA